MIQVTDTLARGGRVGVELPARIRAWGAERQQGRNGGAAPLDIRRSPSLPEAVRQQSRAAGGAAATKDGVLVITAQRFRTQERNRQDGLERLLALIRGRPCRSVKRRPTRPSAAARGDASRQGAPGGRQGLAHLQARRGLKRLRPRTEREIDRRFRVGVEVLSNTGSSVSAWPINIPISVQPRITPSAPLLRRHSISARYAALDFGLTMPRQSSW